MTALFVKQLTTLDFSYLCPERGLVGETWLVDVTLSGDLDEQGMVFDFGHVKKQVKASLDLLADHRLLVPATSKSVTIGHQGEQLRIEFQTPDGLMTCLAPAQAILLVDSPEIGTTTLKPYLEQTLIKELPKNVSGVDLHLYHESIDGAFYHYSHGLKKHLGDCQRIAHGHRSQIEVYLDNHRNTKLEHYWADLWRDIYIATREDLQEVLSTDGVEYYRFSYTSDQGYFELTLPASRCYLIDTDSTVELLAEHMVKQLAELKPNQSIKVLAYEGHNKGACAHTNN